MDISQAVLILVFSIVSSIGLYFFVVEMRKINQQQKEFNEINRRLKLITESGKLK